MRVLELFSGTQSISKICKELDWECVSVDITDELAKPTICIDILKWDYIDTYSKDYFDIITASPPCHTFSNLRRSWINRKLKYFGDVVVTKKMLDDDMINNGVPLLNKTREIISYYKPKYYWIENPSSGCMKNFILDIPFTDVNYCMYGFDYLKPTRLWNNFNFKGKCCNHKSKHKSSLKKIRLSDRYAMPPELIRDLLTDIKNIC